MMGRTHVLGGLNALWLLYMVPTGMTKETAPLLVGLAAFGALLPDLDAVDSKIKRFAVGGIQPFVPLSLLANRTWGHRGLLHSPAILAWLALLLVPLTFWTGWQQLLAFWLGYASHLILDALTVSGIPARPLPRSRLHLLPRRQRFVTGSPAEDALFVLLACSTLTLLARFL